MRNAHILLITIRALANEVAKNLVLAGIGSLTVLDPDIVTEDDLGGQFFIGEEHIGMNVCGVISPTDSLADIFHYQRAIAAAPAIQRLNPRVPVHVDISRLETKNASFYEKFDIVIATELDLNSLVRHKHFGYQILANFFSSLSIRQHGTAADLFTPQQHTAYMAIYSLT